MEAWSTRRCCIYNTKFLRRMTGIVQITKVLPHEKYPLYGIYKNWKEWISKYLNILLYNYTVDEKDTLTLRISVVQFVTCFCKAFRNVVSEMLFPTSSIVGFRSSLDANATASWIIGCIGKLISGIAMFCCRRRRLTASSLIFFWTVDANWSPSL